jgi:hypothetical protein
MSGEKCLPSERKEGEESREACSVKLEAMEEHFHGGQEVDKANTLSNISQLKQRESEKPYNIPNQAAMQHINSIQC